MADTTWRNRIVAHGKQPADQFMANPRNWRTHPQAQREAMKASLTEVGWVAPVIVNRRTGYVVDGHERIWDALQNDNAEVPFIEVDLDEAEEAYVLATFDPIGAMAQADAANLDAVLRDVQSESAAIQAMLAEIAETVTTPGADEWADAFGKVPDEDRAPFQQMTFTLHDEQVEQIRAALTLAKGMGEFADSPNKNSNGNALSRICETFLTDHGQR